MTLDLFNLGGKFSRKDAGIAASWVFTIQLPGFTHPAGRISRIASFDCSLRSRSG